MLVVANAFGGIQAVGCLWCGYVVQIEFGSHLHKIRPCDDHEVIIRQYVKFFQRIYIKYHDSTINIR